MKISYAMNVLNGEPFITYQLASIYPHAHQIVIVEGAYTKFAHASTPDGHSTDRTLELIQAFPDPERKIKLVTRAGFWEDRTEMCNGFMVEITGDILWQVDVDEFYLPWVHDYVSRLFADDPMLDRVSFRVREFFASLDYELAGAIHTTGLSDVRRVHRFQPGDRWLTQRPPTLANADGTPKRIRKEILAPEMYEKGIFIFHPTTLFEKQTFDKFRYYRQMWKGIEQKDRWLYDTWYHFKNPLRVHGTTTFVSWLQRYDGPRHPQLEALWQGVRSGQFPNIAVRDNTDIERYLQSSRYPQDAAIGRAYNDLVLCLQKRQRRAALRHIRFITLTALRAPFRVTYRYCLRKMLALVIQREFLPKLHTFPRHIIRKLLPIRPPISPASVSSGHRAITREQMTDDLRRGWQDPSIPDQQWALVKGELQAMYAGSPHKTFQILADAVRATELAQFSLMEVGCSGGYHNEMLRFMLKTAIDYAGLDYSAALIRQARCLYPEVPFVVGDAAALPVVDASYDVVLSGGVLLHVPEYQRVISETVRAARQWCIFHRTPVFTQAPTTYFTKRAYGVEVVELVFNEQELRRLFVEAGLEIRREFVLFQTQEPLDTLTMKTYVCYKRGSTA